MWCDILQSSGVDQQHAVIEYSELEDCFVLQDLNTSQGTYVNDCRVQNAAVRLAPGDVIVFGYGSSPYMLEVESERQVCLFQEQIDKMIKLGFYMLWNKFAIDVTLWAQQRDTND